VTVARIELPEFGWEEDLFSFERVSPSQKALPHQKKIPIPGTQSKEQE
jgi:hypothetical protein